MILRFFYMAAVLLLYVQPSAALTPVPASPDQVKPLGAGEFVPKASLKNTSGEYVKLLEVIARKPTILLFYRGGWCPYCTTHLSEIGEIEPKLIELGYQIIAISPDTPSKLLQGAAKAKVNYQLLSDSPMTAARAFGLAFKLDDETVKLYKEKYKIDIEADSGMTHHLLPVPAAYVVKPTGEISFAYYNPDYKVRIDAEELLAAAKKEIL